MTDMNFQTRERKSKRNIFYRQFSVIDPMGMIPFLALQCAKREKRDTTESLSDNDG